MKRAIALFVVLTLGSLAGLPAFAQSTQGVADLLRDFGASTAVLNATTGGAKPNPPRDGRPQMLSSNVLGSRVVRVCRYEDSEKDIRIERERKASIGRSLPSEDRKENSLEPSLASFATPVEELYKPNLFELYVKSVTGKELCRFGFDTVFGSAAFFEPPPLGMVPEDYVLGPGDEVYIRAWGSLDLNFVAVIDRSGSIVIPKLGPVKLAGTAYGKSASVLKAALKRQYSDFDASLTLGQLRGVRVYVTGYAQQPGAITVHNLASLSSVVFSSGGPSIAGSFRNIELRRRGEVIARLDLYKLLLEGDKSADRPLLSEDVIHFGSIGSQVAVLGGVNKPAVFELKESETAQDLIRMAGNASPGGRGATVSRLAISGRDEGFKAIADLKAALLADGDIVMVADASMLTAPKDRMVKRIVVQGQVRKPGEYFLPPQAKLTDAIEAAGGLVPGAFIYGLRLTRLTVLEQEKALIERILRELDRDMVSKAAMVSYNQQDAQLAATRLEMSRNMISRLQSFQPEGRLLLPIVYGDQKIPDVALRDGDSITIPEIPASVGVYGSVVNAGSFAYESKRSLEDYISLAGGATKGADQNQTFVILANGQARKAGSGGAFLGRSRGLDIAPQPGDTIVVPEDMEKTSFTRELIQYTTILYQIGLGAAAIKVLKD